MWKSALLFFCLVLAACGDDSNSGTRSAQGADPSRGKRVYMSYCTSCHNVDPSKDGAIGPAVKGASEALLEAKIVRGVYPPGYKPKRDTAMMPPQPALKPSIPDLAAFLK